MGLTTTVRGSVECVEPTIPAVHALHLAECIRSVVGSSAEFMAEVAVSEDVLTDPERRISFADMGALIRRAVEITQQPPMILGCALGLSASASRFGSLGFAAMTCATLRDAILTGFEFVQLITSASRWRLRVEGAQATIELEEDSAFGEAREFIAPALLMALWQIGQQLTGRPLVGDAEFTFPEPPYFCAFAQYAPGCVRFDQPRHCLRFDAALLDLPLATADPAAARQARAQCEQQLRELQPEKRLMERVRGALFADAGRLRAPAQIARGLGMSERTLKRKLAAEGTSYTELLERERHSRALELLRGAASIEEVADRLGYSEPANFTRAFRRWTGHSPRAHRHGNGAARAEDRRRSGIVRDS